MEVAIHCFVTGIWWAASVTVLLPLLIALKYSKCFREMWLSYVFEKWIRYLFDSQFMPTRKKAFDLLNAKLSERDITKPLEVLEIGIGSGANLKFYPENSHLTALDVNVNFLHYFKQKQKKYPHIVYKRTVVSVAENMKEIDDCSMDLVIGTYVLCYVTSINDALKEIKRVLKPGGMFLFHEHVSFPKSEWGFTVQKFTEPLWNIYSNGCHLLRNSGDIIKNSGFSDVVCKKVFLQTLPLYVRIHEYGLAIK